LHEGVQTGRLMMAAHTSAKEKGLRLRDLMEPLLILPRQSL